MEPRVAQQIERLWYERRLRQEDHMLTRVEIEAEYKVVDNRIENPGKFEGEPVWTPYFYGLYVDGEADYVEGDDDDTGRSDVVAVFNVWESERRDWPGLEKAERVRVIVFSSGHVSAEVFA